jgi:hypothetical protein
MSPRSSLRTTLILCALLSVLLFNLSAAAQRARILAPHRPIPPRVPTSVEHHEPGIPRSMVGGFWMIDANRKALLYLRNGLETSSITVTPSLFLSNGAKFKLKPVTLATSGTAVISINEALDKQGISSSATLSGYIEVEYSWAWDPLCLTVTSTDPIHSVIFNSGFQPSVVTDLQVRMLKREVEGMHAVDGMWWKPEPGITGFVALSNTTAEQVTTRVQFSDAADKTLREYQVRVSPHGTKIVALDALKEAAAGSAGGLRVLHTGSIEGLLINGVMEDQATGFSANLAFHYNFTPAPNNFTPTPKAAGSETYTELGLMTGAADPMMRFPVGTVFTPFTVARNVSDQPLTVTPSLYWMGGGTAHSASLQPITLGPMEARVFETPSLLASAGLAAFNGSVNLVLEAQGTPRSLLLAGGSVDRKNTYVFQVFPRTVQESAGKTISYWSTGNGDDTMVTIWNPADESQDYRFSLFFEGGRYQLPVHLEPRATHAFNISEIIQNQIPDEDGNLIPPAVHEGSAEITGAKAHNETILVAVDAGTYNVRKATCSYYCISCDGELLAFVNTTPFAMAKSGTHQLSFSIQDNHGNQYSASGTWGSTQTSVATVSAQNGGSNGLVTGVSSGNSTLWAQGFGSVYNSYYCAYNASCPDNTNFTGSGPGTVLVVTISIKSSGTAAADDSARDAYNSVVGRYGLGNFVDTSGFCTIGYEASGLLNPVSYTGNVILVRTKGGSDYKGATGQTLDTSYSPGTNDTSPATLEDQNPHSGVSNGIVYDLDAPGRKPATNEIWRKRINFFENAQLPDGTYVANEVGFYVRLSCKYGSSGNSFWTDVTGDNVLNLGSTATTWNLK